MHMLFNLIKWDAYGDYKVLEFGKTKEQCKLRMEWEKQKDILWYAYEIVPYTPF